MKFKCIKTLEFPWYPLNEPTWHKKSSPDRFPFIKGEIYESSKFTTRRCLELINESGSNHSTGVHWLHWCFDKFFKEHFVLVKD